MTEAYVHIGWRKTGSSALQAYLQSVTENSRIGDFLVPEVGTKQQSNVVGASPLAHHLLGRLNTGEACVARWKELAGEIDREKAGKVLISTEIIPGRFAAAEPQSSDLFRRCLESFDRVHFIFWLRRQDEFIASLRIQGGKHGSTGRNLGKIGKLPADANYFRLLKKIGAAVPQSRMVAHLYEKGKTNVVREILTDLGLPETYYREVSRDINARVSAEMFRLQLELNRKKTDKAAHSAAARLIAGVLRDSSDVSAGPPAIPLTIDDRKAILAKYEKSNARLCDWLGLDPAFFRPSDAALRALGEFNIPQRVSRRFLDRVVEAIGEPGNRRKKAGLDLIKAIPAD